MDEIINNIVLEFGDYLATTRLDTIEVINNNEMQVEGWLKAELTYFLSKKKINLHVETEKKNDPNKKTKIDLYIESQDNKAWIELKFWIGNQKNQLYKLSSTYFPLKAGYIKNDLIKLRNISEPNKYFIIFYSNLPKEENYQIESDIQFGIEKLKEENFNLKLMKLYKKQLPVFSVFSLKYID